LGTPNNKLKKENAVEALCIVQLNKAVLGGAKPLYNFIKRSQINVTFLIRFHQINETALQGVN
jgi:hypothetical protein